MKAKIVINADFGSSFQEELYTETLIIMLSAWESGVSNSHKKNKAKVSLEFEELKYEITRQKIKKFIKEKGGEKTW